MKVRINYWSKKRPEIFEMSHNGIRQPRKKLGQRLVIRNLFFEDDQVIVLMGENWKPRFNTHKDTKSNACLRSPNTLMGFKYYLKGNVLVFSKTIFEKLMLSKKKN